VKIKQIPLKAKNALAVGNVLEANAILGDVFSLAGKVVAGRQVGRTLGFPTANLKLNDGSPFYLANGVYAVKIRYKSLFYNGMVNIGMRPTFNQNEITIEVNIFDFSDDLYGQDLILYFFDRLRDEMKFPNLEALKLQIILDKQRILELLTNRTEPYPDSK